MSTLLTVALPGLPPTANHIYRTWGRGRTKTPATRQWQERTAMVLSALWRREAVTADVVVDLVFITKDRRRWDIDNRFKALLDAIMMAKIIQDDSQIKRLTGERARGDETKTVVTISLYDKPVQGRNRRA